VTVDQALSRQIEIKKQILKMQSSRAANRIEEIERLQSEYEILALASWKRGMRTSALKKAGKDRGRKMKSCPNCKRRMYAYRDTTTCWYCEHDGLIPASKDRKKCAPGQERAFKRCLHCKTQIHTYKRKTTCRKCGRVGLVTVKKSKGKWVRV